MDLVVQPRVGWAVHLVLSVQAGDLARAAVYSPEDLHAQLEVPARASGYCPNDSTLNSVGGSRGAGSAGGGRGGGEGAEKDLDVLPWERQDGQSSGLLSLCGLLGIMSSTPLFT